jgi:AcrR family transcriptional regulator
MPDIASPTRGRILDAAFTAFMRSGYEGASTNEIARLAHVSKRDLYTHFASKQAMLEACVMERVDTMRRRLDLPVPNSQPALLLTLIQFGRTVLRELTTPEVQAIYRLAILNAETAPDFAQTLDQSGRANVMGGLLAMKRVRARGLLIGTDIEEIADVYMSILLGGLVLRLLMRVRAIPDDVEIQRRAERAAGVVMKLYAAV